LTYQISPDLLSYDPRSDGGGGAGARGTSAEEKVESVRSHAASLRAIITAERAKELFEAKEKAEKQASIVIRLRALQALEMAKRDRASREEMSIDDKMSIDDSDDDCDECAPAPWMTDADSWCKEGSAPMDVDGEIGGLGLQEMARCDEPEECEEEDEEEDECASECSSSQGGEDTDPEGGGGDAAESVLGTPGVGAARDAVDLTALPKALNKRAAELDVGGSLRSTKMTVGPRWARKRQAGLIASKASREAASLGDEEQATERASAFDLLDALTRSGALAIEAATVHVVIASTHCFARSLMATLVHDNINPIEKVERSALIVASSVHRQSFEALLAPAMHSRVAQQLEAQVARAGQPLALTDASGARGCGIEDLLAALTAANDPRSKSK
jgi:hypothetical protein